MLDYARRHRLVFDVLPCHRKRFGGKEKYNYGDLTDEDLADDLVPDVPVERCDLVPIFLHDLVPTDVVPGRDGFGDVKLAGF